MKILLATSSQKPEGTIDDGLLIQALAKSGHDVSFQIWDSKIDWSMADKIVIRSTWDYHYRLPEFLKWVQSVASLSDVANPYETIKWNSNKKYLDDISFAYPTVFVDSNDLENKIKSQFEQWPDMVIKPCISASAHGLFRIDKKSSLDFLHEIPGNIEYMIQPFMSGILSDGEVSLIYFKIDSEVIFGHATIKRPKTGEFRVQEEFGGSTNPMIADNYLVDFGKKALEELNFTYARVDIVDWTQDPKVSEIELIEPDLYMRCHPESAFLFSRAILGEK